MTNTVPTRPARAAPAVVASAGEPRWRARLLGAVELHDGTQRIARFPSRAVAALLARLALAPERAHAREELVELLWPGVALDIGRNRLRQALSTLKSLLEPAGTPGAAVLQADRLAVRVVRGAIGCDAVDFERALRAGHADEARAHYGGELMPGYYDEWIDDERQRLLALYERLPDRAASPAPPPAGESVVSSAGFAPVAITAPLPTYLTRLFGVDMAAARLRALVLSRRLVTLLGPGGSGKTRLAVEVAQSLREPQPWAGEGELAAPFERISFVSLVSCVDAAQLVEASARALQLPPGAGADVAALVPWLAGRRVLLVLDNFEQLVGRAEGIVASLLSQLPALHVLVTSRRALGLDGEQHVAAEPLALPPPDAPPAAAAANPAVALFVDRARAARTDFHLGERNHAAIVALVRALQGLPLAIELAASRVRSFPPAEMVALLAAGEGRAHLALLARGGPRAGHDARHASMAQVIAWSWRLLDAPAQRVMQALTLFPADAGTAAVAAVLGDSVADTAARLDDLVSHTLVRVDSAANAASDAAPRFGLLEPVREFVAETFPAEEADAMATRLWDWLVRWARTLGAHAVPADVAPELPLVHAQLAQAGRAPQAALALALALRRYWETDSLPGRVLAALEDALALASGDALRADAHELLAYLRFGSGQVELARSHAEAALAGAGNEPVRRARALVRRAWVDIAAGWVEDRHSARFVELAADLDEALSLARASGDIEAQARALQQQAIMNGHVHFDTASANLARAEALFAQSQALWLALGDRRQAQARLRNRAQCWLAMGRRAEARAIFEQCEQAAREDGDWVGQMDCQISLSTVMAVPGQWAAALRACRTAIALAWGRWHRHGLAYGLWNAPRLLAHLHKPEAAMKLLAFTVQFWTQGFGPLRPDDERYVRRVRGLVRAQLGAARAEALWHEGAVLDVAAAVRLAQTA
jgi:predicted ATPase